MALTFVIFIGWKCPEQALGGIPLGFGIVVEDKPSELSCSILYRYLAAEVGDHEALTSVHICYSKTACVGPQTKSLVS